MTTVVAVLIVTFHVLTIVYRKHQSIKAQDHSSHICRLLHAGCDLIPLRKLAEQRFKIYWTGTSEWMDLSDKHKRIPPHWLHIDLWAHLSKTWRLYWIYIYYYKREKLITDNQLIIFVCRCCNCNFMGSTCE